MSSIFDILTLICGYSILIPFFVCILLYKRIPEQFRHLVYFVFIATVGETVARILFALQLEGLPALHAYTLIEGIILLLFYREVFRARFKSIYFTIAILLFSLSTILNSFILQHVFEVNSNARTLEALLIIGCAVLLYFFLFELAETVYFKKPLLWINNGVFFYFTLSLLFFLFGNYLMHNYSKALNKMIWMMHAVFLIIFHLILARGIWLLGKKASS